MGLAVPSGDLNRPEGWGRYWKGHVLEVDVRTAIEVCNTERISAELRLAS